MVKLLIDASCTADHKTRSRWGQALKYIWRRRKRKTVSRLDFQDFLHCNGGVVGCAAKSALPKMKPIRRDWGSVLIRSLFKRALIRRNPMRCRKSPSIPRPLVTCELPGRRRTLHQGQDDQEIVRDLKVSRNMARSVLRGFKPSFFVWPSEQCLRDFLPSLLLLLFPSSSPLDFSTQQVCDSLRQLRTALDPSVPVDRRE